MKNRYEIRGGETVIFLDRKDGSVMETTIDTSDLERVKSFPNTWWSAEDHGRGVFYVSGNIQRDGRETSVRLHRWILNPHTGEVVDHINGKPLDNTRKNIRIASFAENNQNHRERAMANNKSSGERGVTITRRGNKVYWRANIQVNGKRQLLYTGTSLEKACEIVRKARAGKMPFSKEARECK